jgi:hypothetical protein
MDPFTIALMGGTALASFLGGQDAKQQAQDNLAYQMYQDEQNRKLASASRQDAFGNIVRYNPGTNQWETVLTPQQRAITSAGEHEQLLGLTKDAARNRLVQEAAFRRGQQADEDYGRTRADYLYGPDRPHSEDAIMGELAGLMARARSGEQTNTNRIANRAFIRQRGNVPIVNSSAPNNSSDLASILLQARQGALNESGQRWNQYNSRFQPELNREASVAMGGGNSPIRYSDINKTTTDQENDIAKELLGASQAGAKAVGAASGNLQKADLTQFGNLGSNVALRGLSGTRSSANPSGTPGNYGGSPETNYLLNPATYGNIQQNPYDPNATDTFAGRFDASYY